MLIELWERLRGYDKWVQTTAKVESSIVEKTLLGNRSGPSSYSYRSRVVLRWKDKNHENEVAIFRVPDDSPLYMLVGGEAIPIRYNPAQPDQFYLRELLQARIRKVATRIGVALVIVGIVFIASWLRERYLIRP